MRVLIIGGTGFIGTHVARQLADQQHKVAVYHRGQTQARLPNGVREFRNAASRFPIEDFPQEIFDFAPDVVIHVFAMGESDAKAAIAAFTGRTGRVIMLSSGDVYRAYGRFIGMEPGPVDQGLLTEDSPLRTKLYPYRGMAESNDSLQYWYEKILAEKAFLSCPDLPSTVLRLPKVYGPGNNQDLATIYANRHQPNWRWTHGYVENIAAAIVLAAIRPQAAGRVYNVGEEHTPTIAERLAWMPASSIEASRTDHFNYAHDIAYDTMRIRQELGFREIIPEREAVLKTLAQN
jgi:nucleoside-diphosphate-sugar epimerase